MTIFDRIERVGSIMQRMLPVIILVLMAVLILDRMRSRQKKMGQLRKHSKRKAQGVIFGKAGMKVIYSPTAAEGHVAVFGGSGLGKTSALLIPTLRSWTGASFVIDISGDICKNVDIPNKMIYEPADPNSIPYDIFAPIDRLTDEDDQNEALEELAFLLMPENEKMADAARFFNTEGRKILTAALIAFYRSGLDFVEICERIVESSWQQLFNAIDGTGNKKAIRYINSFEGANEANTAGCKQAVDSVLKLFATNMRVKYTLRRPEGQEKAFSPAVLEYNNVFVVIDDSKLKLYAPLLHIITAQSLEYFSTRSNDSKTTILFCLDEFASLGKMEITDALRKLRKKHVRIMMLTQSMADLDLIYGRDERMAMMNNFRFKVILGADDTDTQDYFAKLIGYQETVKRSQSTNAHQITHTESEAREWAIEPADLARLGDKLVLLHPEGYLQLRKNFYYK